MKFKLSLPTIWKAIKVIHRLYPIAIQVYEEFRGKPLAEKRRSPITDIKREANKKGIVIGNTEAELVRSAIHFAEAKKGRQ